MLNNRVAIVIGLALSSFALPTLSQELSQGVQPEQSNLSQNLETCYRCHGSNAINTTSGIPTLAGQKPEYLRRQLRNFKHTLQSESPDLENLSYAALMKKFPKRRDPKMSLIAIKLADDQIGLIADRLSQMSCEDPLHPKKSVQAKMLRQPKVVNRCFVCHKPNGISTSIFVPNLAGQDKQYLINQINLFRMNAQGLEVHMTEAKRSHPIMQKQTYQLSEKDIEDISTYYSSLNCNGEAMSHGKPLVP